MSPYSWFGLRVTAVRLAIAATLCIVSGGAAVAASPQGAPQNPPVFRSGVDLVTVDVTVVDRDGKPVTGLTAEDFAVTLDGKLRAVRALDYLAFGWAPGSRVSSARTNNQAGGAAQSRGGRVILLVVDDLSARPTQMVGLRASAQRMLATLDVDDLVGVATTSGLGPVVNPTRDRAAVKAALESKGVVGRNDDNIGPIYMSIPEAIDINRNVAHSFAPDRGYDISIQTTFARVVRRECMDTVTEPNGNGVGEGVCMNKVIGAAALLGKSAINRAAAQVAAYAQFIEALRPAPVPRMIVALSAGIALGLDRGNFAELEPIGLSAARAGVQLYALTEVSGFGDPADLGTGRAAARRDEDDFLTSGVQTIAHAAGGEAFKVSGQADRFFTRIVEETSGVYQLGVEAPMSPTENGFVNVKVSVGRPNVTVRSKTHAMTPSARPEPLAPLRIEEALQTRLAQGGAAFGVPISMATSLRRDPAASGQLQLGVSVQVPTDVAGPLLAMFTVVDDEGRVVQQGRKQVQARPSEDYQLALPVPLAAGRYRLRVGVADANGNIGSLEHSVDATLPHVGTCTVSDLATSWSGADGVLRALTVETLPAGASTVRASLELYPDDPSVARDFSVRLSLVREGDATPLVERDLTPAGTGATRVVSASLPAGQLAAGTYTIQATILESGAVTGSVSAVIRKQ